MSDPVTNIEIEDVLSSIRRLVSEEARKSVPTSRSEALILTPDARIHDGRLADAQDLRDSAKPMPDPIQQAAEAPMSEDVAQTPESSVMPFVAPNQPSVAPVQDAPREDETDAAPAAAQEEAVAPSDDTAPSTIQQARASLEETIAELEAAVSDTDADWEADGEAGHDNSPSRAAPPPELWEDVVVRDAFKPREPAPVAEAETVGAPEPQAETVGSQEPQAETVVAPEPQVEIAQAAEGVATEAALAALADEMESHWATNGTGADTPPEDVLSGEGPQVEDAAASQDDTVQDGHWDQEEAAFEEAVLEETLAAAGLSSEDGAEMIDEEALRAMIVTIVHEELQGALGERITRNVRKLVRREIYRAINSADLT